MTRHDPSARGPEPGQLVEALLGNEHVLLVVLDGGLRVVRVSRAVADCVGRSPERLVGVPFAELVPGADVDAMLSGVRATGGAARFEGPPWPHPVRGAVRCEWTVQRLGPDDDRFLLLVGADRTDQRVAGGLADDRERLLAELAHRVRNNLQLILSLLHEAERGAADPAGALCVLLGRVRTVAGVYVGPIEGDSLAPVDFVLHAERIVQDLGRRSTRPRVKVHVTGGGCGSLTTAIPLGLIVHELVRNAMWHAHPADGVGFVRVMLDAPPAGNGELRVLDDGCGFVPDAADSADFSGVAMVRGLAAQLGGSAVLDTSPGGGTAWTVRFPVR